MYCIYVLFIGIGIGLCFVSVPWGVAVILSAGAAAISYNYGMENGTTEGRSAALAYNYFQCPHGTWIPKDQTFSFCKNCDSKAKAHFTEKT